MAGKGDLVTNSVPYQNLKQSEVELVRSEGTQLTVNGGSDIVNICFDVSSPTGSSVHVLPKNVSTITLILSCMIAAGVQFGWALQLSLLTPYIQTLGINHAFSSFIWLCGPITGLLVQPCVGIWSDKCFSKYGRRRPFILVGSLMISVAVLIIGFSADIGYLLGDTEEHCSTFKGTRTRAAFVFVIGFWMLDLANNTVQGPARALLADLSGPDQRNFANSIFCSWMAVGNILGYSSGASGKWHRWFPFLTTRACCEACGNLKAAFLVSVLFLTFCTMVTLCCSPEVPLHMDDVVSDAVHLLKDCKMENMCSSDSKPNVHIVDRSHTKNHVEDDKETICINPIEENQYKAFSDKPGAVLINLLTSLRHLPPGMHSVLLVMALCWLSWFPFFLFDTDWMGREVFHGDPKGDASEMEAYDRGVRQGSFGLLLNSVILGISSFFIEPLCRWMGSGLVWSVSNFIVFACMAGTAVISFVSVRSFSEGIENAIGVDETTQIASLVVFALLGFPLAITYSVPFSVTAELTADSGGGQGLAIGVLNLAVVIPQMVVSLGAGPWDALFGGGNVPAFVMASVFALAAAIVGMLKLPQHSQTSYKPAAAYHFG